MGVGKRARVPGSMYKYVRLRTRALERVKAVNRAARACSLRDLFCKCCRLMTTNLRREGRVQTFRHRSMMSFKTADFGEVQYSTTSTRNVNGVTD
jgi:hypothetical protein